jgi:predicted ATP-binding protein involved in virulence
VIVTRLSLVNVRAIEVAELTFRPGMNVVVGVNGVGKSTVLDVLRTSMSHFLPVVTDSRARPFPFAASDVRFGQPFLDTTMSVSVGKGECQLQSRKWRAQVAEDAADNLDRLRRQILESTRLRERARTLIRELEQPQGVEDSYTLLGDVPAIREALGHEPSRPNCVFFATSRSLVERSAPIRGNSAGGVAAAYATSLVPRSWQLRQFAAWMRAQAALASEDPKAKRHLAALQGAAERFLPSYVGLRPDEDGDRLLIDDKRGATLEVGQLSDGERGVLAMVLDLARRLSQANPNSTDPLIDASAVVLIDELDLHLHPAWQRTIVRRLLDVFPQCQFIATTHSPQVVGEVEHDRIQIISDGAVYSPTHSFGVDSSRVLEEIMDAPPRTADVQEVLGQLSKEVANKNLAEAQRLVIALAAQLGENDPEVVRARTLLEFLEGER